MDDLTLPMLEGTETSWFVGRLWRSSATPVEPGAAPWTWEESLTDWPFDGFETRVIVTNEAHWLLHAHYRRGRIFESVLRGEFSFQDYLTSQPLDDASLRALARASSIAAEDAERDLRRHPRWHVAVLLTTPAGPFRESAFRMAWGALESYVDVAGRRALVAYDLWPAETLYGEIRIVKPSGRDEWVPLPRVQFGATTVFTNSERHSEDLRRWTGDSQARFRLRRPIGPPVPVLFDVFDAIRERVDGLAAGRESLSACAYWVLTRLESAAGGGTTRAASQFGISRNVLTTLSRLATNSQRKAGEQVLGPIALRWLEAALGAIVAHLGEIALGGGNADLLTLERLPTLGATPRAESEAHPEAHPDGRTGRQKERQEGRD